jgi:hypothetical protein
MPKFDGKLDGSLASSPPLIEALEQAVLTPEILDSGKTIYLPGTEPSIQQTYYWLTLLARQLKQDQTTEFLIERMQPSWLETPTQKWLYRIAIGLITGSIVALIYAGTTGVIGASIGGLTYGIILACTQEIYPITRLRFSLKFAQAQLLGSVFEGLWWGVIYGIIDALICWLLLGLKWLFLGMADSVVWGLIEGFIWGLFVPEFDRPQVSNQGMRESALNAAIFTALGGVTWVVLYSGVLLAAKEPLEPVDLLIDGIGNGVFFGIYVGGLACLQHLVLRLILKQSGAIPWNYAKFLDYATALGFLAREGGRYRFIHESVQEHFAQMSTSNILPR